MGLLPASNLSLHRRAIEMSQMTCVIIDGQRTDSCYPVNSDGAKEESKSNSILCSKPAGLEDCRAKRPCASTWTVRRCPLGVFLLVENRAV
jgi:hypothetical protein